MHSSTLFTASTLLYNVVLLNAGRDIVLFEYTIATLCNISNLLNLKYMK